MCDFTDLKCQAFQSMRAWALRYWRAVTKEQVQKHHDSASAPVQSKAIASSSAILSSANAPERFAILCTEHLHMRGLA